MKKTPDLSETFSKGATEAKEILQQTANLIETEWQRLLDAVEESDSVPETVKTAVDRLGHTMDDVKEFVVTVGPQVVVGSARVARQVGVPIPEEWLAPEDEEAAADAADVAKETIADDTIADDTIADDTIADDTVTEVDEDTAAKADEDPTAEATEDTDEDEQN